VTTTTSSLSREQRRVVRLVQRCLDRGQVQTIGGYAGTGKTHVLRALAEALPNFAVCAFTGKAANVLRRRGVGRASTIHSVIYTPTALPNGEIRFRLRPRAEVYCEGFLVDEASMVGEQIYDHLLSFGLPVVFVGDHGQLPPVEGNFNLMADPVYRLEEIHRNAGEIARFAEHLRKGKSPWKFLAKGRVHVLPEGSDTDDLLLGVDQVICAFNITRVSVNRRVRELLGRAPASVLAGDRVMCLQNRRQLGLFNGMQGAVVKVRAGRRPTLDLLSGDTTYRNVPYDPNAFGQENYSLRFSPDGPVAFDFAYCVTCHKAQGDEFDDVLVYDQPCRFWEHPRWAYTAASRARRSLNWVTRPRRTLA
jgi:exodeoxyribonuclease V